MLPIELMEQEREGIVIQFDTLLDKGRSCGTFRFLREKAAQFTVHRMGFHRQYTEKDTGKRAFPVPDEILPGMVNEGREIVIHVRNDFQKRLFDV